MDRALGPGALGLGVTLDGVHETIEALARRSFGFGAGEPFADPLVERIVLRLTR